MPTIDLAGIAVSPSTLMPELQRLRADIHVLAHRLGSHFGEESPVSFRAGELAAAVQRLEWALARSHHTHAAAHAAAS